MQIGRPIGELSSQEPSQEPEKRIPTALGARRSITSIFNKTQDRRPHDNDALKPFLRIIDPTKPHTNLAELSPLYRKCRLIPLTEQGLTHAAEVVNKMVEILTHYREATGEGTGLAANQMEEELAIAILRNPDGTFEPYINPTITGVSSQQTIYSEKCISGRPLYVAVVRPEVVQVEWYDLGGVRHEELKGGIFARRLQHEIQHLEGEDCYTGQGAIPDSIGTVSIEPKLRLFP